MVVEAGKSREKLNKRRLPADLSVGSRVLL